MRTRIGTAEMKRCPQIATRPSDLTCLIAPAADAASVRSLVVSSWSTQVVRWLVPLGQGRWNAGWGIGGGGGHTQGRLGVVGWGCCAFRWDEPGEGFGLLWWVRGRCVGWETNESIGESAV